MPFIADYIPLTCTPRIRFALVDDAARPARSDEIWFDDDWVDSGRRIFAIVVPLLPLRRTDNTDIVRCEHSFRPDGTIFQSSPSSPPRSPPPPPAFSALAADCCSLPLFICNHRYPDEKLTTIHYGMSFVCLFIYLLHCRMSLSITVNSAVDFEKESRK